MTFSPNSHYSFITRKFFNFERVKSHSRIQKLSQEMLAVL